MGELSKLKAWLRTQNLTQLELADQLDVTPQHLSRVINGKAELSAGIRWDFASRYGYELARELLEADTEQQEVQV